MQAMHLDTLKKSNIYLETAVAVQRQVILCEYYRNFKSFHGSSNLLWKNCCNSVYKGENMYKLLFYYLLCIKSFCYTDFKGEILLLPTALLVCQY